MTPPGGTAADDRGMSPALFQQLTLAILDHSAEDGLRMIATVRSYLDTWETFLQDRHELVDLVARNGWGADELEQELEARFRARYSESAAG